MKGNPHKSKKIYLAVSEASLHVIAAGPQASRQGRSVEERRGSRRHGGETQEGGNQGLLFVLLAAGG